MSERNEVPAWAVPVLEALDQMANALVVGARLGSYLERTARELHTACAAALASDAGTPEGERTVVPESAINPAWTTMQAHEEGFRASMAVPAPLAESGAAPTTNAPEISTSLVDAAPDAELDSLLTLLCGYEYDRGVADYVGDAGAVRDHTSSAVDTIAAIHAHVAQVTREARAEGERAATGEVVGTGKLGVDLWSKPAVQLDPDCTVRPGDMIPVDLVLRRDKEGV